MASKVSNLLKVVGRKIPDPGAHLYHAADAVGDGGHISHERRHKMRKALHRQRMRATGMTDDIFGSKEVGGAQQNRYEKEIPEPRH